jgi:rare lipoprotein A
MQTPTLPTGKRHVARKLVWLALTTGCSLPPLGTWSSPPARSTVEVGRASWYGPGFHGNRTSSGEVYNQHDLTAAHQTLPLGSRVMVTSLANGRSVELRINDRGPFVDGRIIDLSYGAAKALDLVGPGTERVRIERLEDDVVSPSSMVTYAAQAAAFRDGRKAVALKDSLDGRFSDVYMSPVRTPENLYYRVRTGPFFRRVDAATRARQLGRLGYPAIVVEEVREE